MTRILVVDDSASIRQLAAFTLKSGGFDCTEAKDGVEALEKCLAENFDLVITDLNMPNMGGLELATKLREQASYADTPILVLTTEKEGSKPDDLAVTDWILKPFNPEMLLETIKGVIDDMH